MSSYKHLTRSSCTDVRDNQSLYIIKLIRWVQTLENWQYLGQGCPTRSKQSRPYLDKDQETDSTLGEYNLSDKVIFQYISILAGFVIICISFVSPNKKYFYSVYFLRLLIWLNLISVNRFLTLNWTENKVFTNRCIT